MLEERTCSTHRPLWEVLWEMVLQFFGIHTLLFEIFIEGFAQYPCTAENCMLQFCLYKLEFFIWCQFWHKYFIFCRFYAQCTSMYMYFIWEYQIFSLQLTVSWLYILGLKSWWPANRTLFLAYFASCKIICYNHLKHTVLQQAHIRETSNPKLYDNRLFKILAFITDLTNSNKGFTSVTNGIFFKFVKLLTFHYHSQQTSLYVASK